MPREEAVAQRASPAMTKARSRFDARLDHVAIWVEDIEKTCDFLTNVVGWKRHPMQTVVDSGERTTGGMVTTFVGMPFAESIWPIASQILASLI